MDENIFELPGWSSLNDGIKCNIASCRQLTLAIVKEDKHPQTANVGGSMLFLGGCITLRTAYQNPKEHGNLEMEVVGKCFAFSKGVMYKAAFWLHVTVDHKGVSILPTFLEYLWYKFSLVSNMNVLSQLKFGNILCILGWIKMCETKIHAIRPCADLAGTQRR